MKVLLVYPEFPDTYWSFRHALTFEGKQAAFPPLGLLTVSPMLPKDWERRLVDMNVEELWPDDIEWADIVMVSAMIVQSESLEEVVQLCRKLGKKVVVGGPYVSTSSERLPDADHIFIGEAETTLPEFINDLELGIARKIYKADERPSLHNTPVPDFRLIDMTTVQRDEYAVFTRLSISIANSATSSRSTAACREQNRISKCSPELDALKATGWRGLVFIVDDNFIGNKKNVRLFMPDLIEWSRQK